ncbi:hypothetical protein [Paenibacillus sp. JCM 10914]|uniref:hypothetical protein n=1 Tax=Paenibacillus sp. JCM 10914 TaxID=1236974 RepID=UPI0003CCB8E5|nr:hypothetical protein [Paenibacillus sp. JCM 10914]GAE05756.1 hypothetical protein JCM10914_1877 [Paenibacillus sp. JCM 10914]
MLDAEIEGEFKDLLTQDKLIKGMTEEGAEHVYAVDIMDSTLSEDITLYKREMFAGIREGTERDDKALHFIRQYLQAAQ